MARKVNFYSISLWNDRGITNYSVSTFFETIETQLFDVGQEQVINDFIKANRDNMRSQTIFALKSYIARM